MTSEMGQIDTVDNLTKMAFEPIHDPLHAGEPENEARIKEVRKLVNWAIRLTFKADGVSQEGIDEIVKLRSAGIVGINPYTGEKDVALATPQFTAETEKARRMVEKSIRRRLKVVINNASKSRLITPEKADRLIDEVPIRTLGLRFQPYEKPRRFVKEPEIKNVYSGYSGGYARNEPRNEQVVSGPKKAILVIAGSSFLLSSCAVVPTAVETAVATPTQQATQSVDVPIGVPTESPKPTSKAEKTPTQNIESRALVTAEDVKNVEDPIQISLDKSGKLTGFPENTPQADIKAARPFFDAVAAKFPNAKIFYTKNTVSEQFALYAVSSDGKLYFSTVSYSDGPAQFNDYPVTFESANGSWRVSGSYVGIDIPGGTWSTIWKNGFLQFIANKQELSDGSYYTKYMVNKTLVSENPWQNVPGISEAPSGPEIANALDVANYQIIDGNIQEKRGNTWQEVGVPYEKGYIAYVEIHDGKVYGIDSGDRAVVVRNAETGEWEKFERPLYGANFADYEHTFTDRPLVVKYKFDTSNLDLSDVQPDQIVRLKDKNGEAIPWGYIEGSYVWKGRVDNESNPIPTDYPNDIKISGYFLGKTELTSQKVGSTVEENHTGYVFEIPYKYGRQIIVFIYQPDESSFEIKVNSGDEYGKIDRQVLLTTKAFAEFMSSYAASSRGQQSVIDFNILSVYMGNDQFWQSLLGRKAYDVKTTEGLGENLDYWFNSKVPLN